MSDGNDVAQVEVAADAPAVTGPMSVEDALQEFLKRSLAHGGLSRGLRDAPNQPHQVGDAKKLGEWVGLCKIDREGTHVRSLAAHAPLSVTTVRSPRP
ncbi:hypothetical protein BDF19DRAFT_419792 [Syncephalis fuscata]|nr:hypothetical protein BDF19DRAFT_419792 [Syncephalis fuscata]